MGNEINKKTLSESCQMTYKIIWDWFHSEGEYPLASTVAEARGLSVDSIHAHIRKLKRDGYLSLDIYNKKNGYERGGIRSKHGIWSLKNDRSH